MAHGEAVSTAAAALTASVQRASTEMERTSSERDEARAEVERLRLALLVVTKSGDHQEAVRLARSAVDASKRRAP